MQVRAVGSLTQRTEDRTPAELRDDVAESGTDLVAPRMLTEREKEKEGGRGDFFTGNWVGAPMEGTRRSVGFRWRRRSVVLEVDFEVSPGFLGGGETVFVCETTHFL